MVLGTAGGTYCSYIHTHYTHQVPFMWHRLLKAVLLYSTGIEVLLTWWYLALRAVLLYSTGIEPLVGNGNGLYNSTNILYRPHLCTCVLFFLFIYLYINLSLLYPSISFFSLAKRDTVTQFKAAEVGLNCILWTNSCKSLILGAEVRHIRLF